MRSARPRPDAAGLAQRQVTLVGGGQRAARLPAPCSASSPSLPCRQRSAAGESHSSARQASHAARQASHTVTAALPPTHCGARTAPASGRRRPGGGPRAAGPPAPTSCPPLPCGPRSRVAFHALVTALVSSESYASAPPHPSARSCAVRAADGPRTCPHRPARTRCERATPRCRHARRSARASPAPHRCAVTAGCLCECARTAECRPRSAPAGDRAPPRAARAVRALTAARAHRRMHPPAPPPCSAISWERSAGGTRQCPPRHARVARARDHPSPPQHARSAVCSLSAARTRVRPPPPRCAGMISLSPTLRECRGPGVQTLVFPHAPRVTTSPRCPWVPRPARTLRAAACQTD